MAHRIGLWAIMLMCTASSARAEPSPAPSAQTASEQVSDERAARQAFHRGRAAYDDGRFAEAAEAFEQAYRLSGRDALLYNLYLAHRDANQQEQAAEALRAFLAKVKDIENRGQLEARLRALDEGIAWERTQREQALAEAAARERAAEAVPSEEERARPRKLRRAGYALAGTGAALLLGALATGVAANKRSDDLEAACDADRVCPPELQATAEGGKRLAHATDALLFGGLAVAAGGATLIALSVRAQRRLEKLPSVGAACVRAGCRAALAVRF